MQEVSVRDANLLGKRPSRRHRYFSRLSFPPLAHCSAALLSTLLVVLSFPDFNLSPLAWVALAPLFIVIARSARSSHGFLLGWLTAATYLYASCYWLTYPMIHYAGIPWWVAYPLLAPATIIVGLFPAFACAVLARACRRWGTRAVLAAPALWTASEWARLEVTGQLWNALGYTQAYTPALIQPARWGGVYAVSFLLAACAAAVAYFFIEQRSRRYATPVIIFAIVVCICLVSNKTSPESETAPQIAAVVVAVQPNVIPNFDRPASEVRELFERHLSLSAAALNGVENDARLRGVERVVIFPESPMNFRWTRDAAFRRAITDFAARYNTSILFNALEPAPHDGGYNSAVLVSAGGELVERYDKIQLLAFGEYVPLPSWIPGREFVRAVVGEFTPGERYTLMPLGTLRSGVFICFESAFPGIARRFTQAGAQVLINISNDAYQGRTPILRQHLANSIFRAVENDRPLLRITNTGITARISPRGEVLDETEVYQPATRTWVVTDEERGKTFYTTYGDVFAVACFVFTVALFVSTLRIFRSRKV